MTAEIGTRSDQAFGKNRVCFEVNRPADPEVVNDLDIKIDTLFEAQPADTWSVILHNDPINGVDFVVRVIKSVFSYRTSKAIRLMLKAHFSGRATVWSGSEKEARKRQKLMIGFGPDPNMLRKGADPLTVTIELNV